MLPRWAGRRGASILRRLEISVFPYIGYIPVTDLRARDVIDRLRKMEAEKKHDKAKRCLHNCSQIMRYAVQTDRIKSSFVPDLKGVLVGHRVKSYASIEPDKLPELLEAIKCNRPRLYRHTILAITLLMLTFVRTSELIEARWNEFDFEKNQWVIPPERMKMRLEHIVPLSTQAIAVLTELKEYSGKREFVFPHRSEPKKTMGKVTILKGLRLLGYKGKMTGHGFRSLAMTTIKEQLGYRHEVVDRQLAHIPKSSIDRAYDRAPRDTFMDARKKHARNKKADHG